MSKGQEFLGGPIKDEKIEGLETDLDTRLAGLWRQVSERTEWDLEAVAAYMRAAYGKGYADAVREPTRGQLMIDHGYRVPDVLPIIFPDLER